MNKAENQLTKDVNALIDILADIPPSQIIFQTVACFPDASSSELHAIFCCSCLETGIVSQEDLAKMSLLQKKTLVPEKSDLVYCCTRLSVGLMLRLGTGWRAPTRGSLFFEQLLRAGLVVFFGLFQNRGAASVSVIGPQLRKL